MELRLQKLIESVEEMSDIHNMDYSNPMLLNFRHPDYNPADPDAPYSSLVKSTFVTAASVDEPAHLGLPVNAVWFVMQPYSSLYRRALKLVSTLPPDQSGLPNVITTMGYAMSWVNISRYDMIFNVRQEYGDGVPGPRGTRQIIFMPGVWSAAVAYPRASAIKHNGSFYVALTATTGQDPADPASPWMQLSRAGDEPIIDYPSIIAAVQARLDAWTPLQPNQ